MLLYSFVSCDMQLLICACLRKAQNVLKTSEQSPHRKPIWCTFLLTAVALASGFVKVTYPICALCDNGWPPIEQLRNNELITLIIASLHHTFVCKELDKKLNIALPGFV